MHSITERAARKRDLNELWAIVQRAQTAMGELGIDQWQDGFPNPEVLQNDIASGMCRILTQDNAIVGSVVLGLEPEDDYNYLLSGAWKGEGEYIVVHRSVVDPRLRGHGIAERLFAIAEREARRRSIRVLRVDTHKDNRPMRRALEKFGFEYRGEIEIYHDCEVRLPRIVYEKLLDEEQK